MQQALTHLCRREQSCLLLIDLQERLLAAMPPVARQQVEQSSLRLLAAARQLDIPVEVTLQYPRGLGALVPRLAESVQPEARQSEKTTFSCCALPDLRARLRGRDCVICGVETHVCVLQTALELLAAGERVFVVADAVCSRSPEHKHNGLERLRAAGAVITNHESVIFEWLRDAADPQFRVVSRLLRD